jgi:hypothetical protein
MGQRKSDTLLVANRKGNTTMQSIQIEIDVARNTLICGINGGNAYLPPGATVEWHSAASSSKFTLQFFRLGLETDGKETDVRELPSWPFLDPEPKGGLVAPTHKFVGHLKADRAVAYKYWVTVGNLRLDPIIVVDR